MFISSLPSWTLVSKVSVCVAFPSVLAMKCLEYKYPEAQDAKDLKKVSELVAGLAGTILVGSTLYGVLSNVAPMAKWVLDWVNPPIPEGIPI